ncbi:MAG: hypothetical protein Q7R93_00765 [bacterium]|nr:hypothetical protein [bacterium]
MKAQSLILFPLWKGYPEKGVVQLSDSILFDVCPGSLLDTDVATRLSETQSFAYWSHFGHRGTLLPPKDGTEVYGRFNANELQAQQPKGATSLRDRAVWALIRAMPGNLPVILRWIL